MASIASIFNCNICAEIYTDSGDKAPVLFQCGHGCCGGCASSLVVHALRTTTQTPRCHQCRAFITLSSPNYELVQQMRSASEEMVKLVAAKNQAVKQFEKIRTKTIEAAVSDLLVNSTPSVLSKKLEEIIPTLIELEIYKDVNEAQEDLLGRVQEALLIGAYNTLDYTSEDDMGNMLEKLAEKFSEYGEYTPEELVPVLKSGYIKYCESRERPIPAVLVR